MTTTTEPKPTARRPRKSAGQPQSDAGNEQSEAAAQDTAETKPAKASSKTSLVLDMLQRPEGATIEQLVTATGWLPHTTRAVLTGLKKKGHVLTSEKVEGGARVYRVTSSAPAEAGV